MDDGPTRPLSFLQLLLALVCPVAVIFLSRKVNLGIEKMIVMAILRSTGQLMFAGYILLAFIFEINSPFVVVLYLSAMIFIAAIEVTARQVRTYSGHLRDAILAVFVGGGLIGAYGSIVVFRPSPWWQPKVLIPTAGMIIGNSISGPAISIDRLLSDVSEKTHEVEVRLAFGATGLEAVSHSVKSAIVAAIMPLLNMMSVVGLVSIPGMMVGQLLGGAGPLAAAEYQLAILWLICATTAFATYIALYLAVRHAVFDTHDRLTMKRIIKKSKMDTLSAAFYVCKSFCCLPASLSSSSSSSSNTYEYEMVTNTMIDISLAPNSTPSHRRGKVEYTITTNSPKNGMDTQDRHEDDGEGEAAGVCVLQLDRVNVYSGEELLFSNAEGLSLSLRRGERLIVQGPSGIGKTRLLRGLCKLDDLAFGEVRMMPVDKSGVPSVWRSRCIYVPQSLPPLCGSPVDLLIESNNFASRLQSMSRLPTDQELRDLCRQVESSMGLGIQKMDELWSTLSGGERQRAAISVALILAKSLVAYAKDLSMQNQPGSVILLLDEPTSACDHACVMTIEQALISSGITLVVISHDFDQAKRLGTKSIVFQEMRCCSGEDATCGGGV